MSNVMFYEQPIALNRDLHRSKKVAPAQSLAFAKNANAVHIVGAEFGDASKEYAVVFSPQSDGSISPVVVLGFRNNENLMLADDKWLGKYLPAFIRRYPFVLAETSADQKTVCIDQAYSGFNDTVGEPLFDADGANTVFFQNALDFLNQYQVENLRTAQFCKRLQDSGILVQMNAKADLFDGSSFSLNGLLIVDEKKMLALGDREALELFRAGELSWIYAHLMSLANLNGLVERLAALRRAETATEKSTDEKTADEKTPVSKPAKVAKKSLV